MPKRHSIAFVKESFSNYHYTLLDNVYTNCKTKLNFICNFGHTSNITFKNWLRGNRCQVCAKNAPLNLLYIYNEFSKEGYSLLSSDYTNSKSKLDYMCANGHLHSISFDNWRGGARCPSCYKLSKFGKGHPNWQGGISKLPYCTEWTKQYKEEIKERDNYQCQNPYCYGNSKRLVIHHVDYTKTICGPDNLIVVCSSCNIRANKDRKWHKEWYQAILNKKYNYKY